MAEDRIQRALISVSDKSGLLPFVHGLQRLGIQIVSTGGTAKLLREQGIKVQEISDFTGFPEILTGRVKTLHPKVHGGILARREDKDHLRQVKKLGLKLIDLVVVNLYPFEQTARKGGALADLIEQIDIGGVSLLRSAAKNFRSVSVVCRPSQYSEVLDELRRGGGKLSEPTRMRLAVEAFSETAYYDSVINQALARRSKFTQWPAKLVLAASQKQVLRYGENPHQRGSLYELASFDKSANGVSAVKQLHGKELSFNNLLDIDAAFQLAGAFAKPTAVVIKHMNPCGAASAPTLAEAFKKAWAGDPLSAFGGIVGLNRPVDETTAKKIFSGFVECVVAPAFSAQALEWFRKKKNLRVVQRPLSSARPFGGEWDVKQITGGLLVQQPDRIRVEASRWRLATKKKPTDAQKRDLLFAWVISKHVRSNAIVLVKGEQVVGVGAGQTSRVDSVRIALKKAGPRAKGSVLASDGFFPKPDGPSFAVRGGIKAIVQPGGSVQDPAVIKVAEKARVPMYLTGERHFKH
jgi:phosphoribosylaminoimidazolecarboxamide formyltransferase/IMP cyclohydrolase